VQEPLYDYDALYDEFDGEQGAQDEDETDDEMAREARASVCVSAESRDPTDVGNRMIPSANGQKTTATRSWTKCFDLRAAATTVTSIVKLAAKVRPIIAAPNA
jgi:hypothetical protein